MSLLSQDVGVTLKYVLAQGQYPTYDAIGKDLTMSASNVFAAVRRAVNAKLLEQQDTRVIRPVISNIEEFLVHGARYAFYPERGNPVRGVPTAHAAPPLNREMNPDPNPPVWPWPAGTAYGPSLAPLWLAAPMAAFKDPQLYELLALVDALRDGKVRERKLAQEYLHKRLKGDWS
jgi:hypothetical protein